MYFCPGLRRLSSEHARWRAQLARRAPEGGARRADLLLALWDGKILPRLRAEEEVLVPELARRLSEADATVLFTLADHVALRRLSRALRVAEGAARAAAAEALEQRLAEHAAFEKRTLFPALQEALGCDRIAALETELVRTAREAKQRPAEGLPAVHEARNGRKRRKP
jgi:hypothetical protein